MILVYIDKFASNILQLDIAMYYKTKPERGNAMDDSNVNYKEKYLELMRAAEKAINILIQAQRDCEEKYISESENSAAE